MLVIDSLQILVQRMEEPERRIGRMIEPIRFSFGEHVRDEPVPNVVRKGTEDVARSHLPPGGHRETFQADHGVTAPIGKPVVAGDDTTNLVAVGARPGSIFAPANRGENKLVGGPDQFAANIVADVRSRLE